MGRSASRRSNRAVSAPKRDPINPTDEAALDLVRRLAGERIAVLGTLDPQTGFPAVSRVTVLVEGGVPVVLVSDLSHHTKALRADPRCSLLLGEPGPKGDPLTHPRVTLFAHTARVERNTPEHMPLRDAWLAAHPKAALYIDFGDFAFWRLDPVRADLNGGFGKAYALTRKEWMAAFET